MWFTYVAAIALLHGDGGPQGNEPLVEERLAPVLHPDRDDGWAPRPLRTARAAKEKSQPKAPPKRTPVIETKVELPAEDDDPVDAAPPLLPPLGAPKRMSVVREAEPIPDETPAPAKNPTRASSAKSRKAPTPEKYVDDDAPLLDRTIRVVDGAAEENGAEENPKTPLPKLPQKDAGATKRWPPSNDKPRSASSKAPEIDSPPPPALFDPPKTAKPTGVAPAPAPNPPSAPGPSATPGKNTVLVPDPTAPNLQQTPVQQAPTQQIPTPAVENTPSQPPATMVVPGPTMAPEATAPAFPGDSTFVPNARPMVDPRLMVDNAMEGPGLQQAPAMLHPARGQVRGPACPPDGVGLFQPAEELTNWVAGTRSYLLMKRQVQGRPIALDAQANSLVATTDDVGLGSSFAQEFFVERRFDTAFGWEVVGLLSDDDRRGKSFQSGGGVSFPTDGAAQGFFRNFGSIDATASSKLWSVGTGLVEHFFAASPGPIRAQLSVGPRFLGVYEDFSALGAVGGGRAGFGAQTENSLFGADVGAAASWENIMPYLTLSAGAKYGVFGNVYHVQQSAFSAGPGVALGNFTKSSRFANMIDLNVEADYKVAHGFHIMGGYRMLLLSGLARAAEQPNFDSTALPNAYTGGNLLVHGLFVGARIHWGGVTDPNVRYGQSRPYTVTVE